MARTPTHENCIDGKWISSATGKTFENRNPANTDELLGRYQDSDERDAAAAVDAAAEAFKTWRLVPGPQRGEMLFRLGEIISRRKEEFSRDMVREMGKALKEARGDVQEAIDMAYLMGGEGRRLHGATTPSELPDKFDMAVRSPIGVCAFITPWSFPMAIPAWKATAALICGDTIVIKPATDTPQSVINFAAAIEEAEDQMKTVLEYIEIGKAEGATLAAGGKRLTGKAHAKGWFLAPTVFTDCDPKMRISQEEIFGPVTSVIPIRSLDEAIEVANDSEYGLSSAIFTQDVNTAFKAMRDLESGLFYVNLPTIGAEAHLPFGDNEKTGNGHREAGLAGLDVFSEWKSCYDDFSGKIQKAQVHVPAGEGYIEHGAHKR